MTVASADREQKQASEVQLIAASIRQHERGLQLYGRGVMDIADLRPVLQAAALNVDSFNVIPVDGCEETVLRCRFDGEWLDTWRQLRASVVPLGWWPIFYDDYVVADSVSRFDMDGPDGLDVAPMSIMTRAPALDVASILEDWKAESEDWLPDDDWLAWRLGESPAASTLTATKARQAIGAGAGVFEVDRWILDQEVALGVSNDATQVPQDRATEGFLAEQVLYLIPNPLPWSPSAYLGGASWGWPHTDVRTAMFRLWNLRWGAEMMVNWGSVTFSVAVSQPPTSIEDAWNLATEMMILFPNTAAGARSTTMVALARSLVGAHRWTLIGSL